MGNLDYRQNDRGGFESSPQVQLSKLVNNFKTVSARLIRKEFKDQVDKYYYKPLFWSNSYCIISSGGAPIEIIKKYIENQDKPISTTTLLMLK